MTDSIGVADFFQGGFFAVDYENKRAKLSICEPFMHKVVQFVGTCTILAGPMHNVVVLHGGKSLSLVYRYEKFHTSS